MASVQPSRCKGKTQKNTICHRFTKALNGFCYEHQDQFQSNPTIAINPSRKACIPSSTVCQDLAERGAHDSPITIFDGKESKPVPASVTYSASSAAPEVPRECGHSACNSADFCHESQEGAQTPANPLPAQSPSDSSANAGFTCSTEENKVANHVKQASSLFTNMCEEEKDRILVYIRGMLGMNAHGASKSAKGQGKDGEFLPDGILSDKEYELLLAMINTYRKWLPELFFRPSIIPAELQIQSRDHIPIIAACFNSSLENVKALYGQVGHSESLTRQMLSIAALRNRKDLALYCLEQGARLDTHDIYDIHENIMGGKSFTTCMFLVAKGLDINRGVEYLGDILSTAVENNHFSWVRFCLENGADPNLNIDLNTGNALASAARHASVKVASLLLKYDAKLVCSGALALAAQHGKLNMVKFLLKEGAFVDENCARILLDYDEEDKEGTALHLVKKGRVDILKYLLESGANRSLTDHKGRTPLEKFPEMKDMKLVDALKDAPSKAGLKMAT